jgi:predicted DNA-binding protein YlxM (UPF0122 family)
MKYIKAAINNNYTLKEIASNINVSDSAVKEILERYRNCIKS